MSEPIWSRLFAREIAKTLAPKKSGEEDELVGEIMENLRYLPGEQVNWACDLASFLSTQPQREECRDRSVRQLREVRDYLLFLRSRYGHPLPADEQDHWTEDDLAGLTAQGLRDWDHRELAGES